MSFFAGTTDGGFKIFVIDSGIITRQVGCSPCSAIPVVLQLCVHLLALMGQAQPRMQPVLHSELQFLLRRFSHSVQHSQGPFVQ